MDLKDVTEAVESSDVARIESMKEMVKGYHDPWQIHLALYPAAQRVLNPPFINPHLPKMYNICRDFVPYLSKEGMSSLVYLELTEYARRGKLEGEYPEPPRTPEDVAFGDAQKAIAARDREKATLVLYAFLQRKGGNELLRRLLLLGSNYLDSSLGHSVSCTAFILLEILERKGIYALPALFLLADYFCKGGFHETPVLKNSGMDSPLSEHLFRSVTGAGFIDIHHTITLYAIERTKPFFTSEEYGHLLASWIEFMGQKETETRSFDSTGKIREYGEFQHLFSQLDAGAVLDAIGGMLVSSEGRFQLSGYLISGVCDLYQGNYNPHYLTALGAFLWLMHSYPEAPVLLENALYQYLSFYFGDLKAEN
jgi:hypothetical protein